MLKPEIDAIAVLQRQRNAVILAHNDQTPDIFHGSPTSPEIARRSRGKRRVPGRK